MRCWAHFGITLYFAFIWMCAYVDKIYIKQRCVCLQLCGHFKLAQQKLFKFYYDPFVKRDNPTFDDFNFLFILSNHIFPMN
jgi:hypothetical protein